MYTIKVTGVEHRSDGSEHSTEYGHGHIATLFATLDAAKVEAQKINPKEFVSALLTDFRGVSGEVSVEVFTLDGDGELDSWEEVRGCLIEFEEDGDGTAIVDGVRIDDENFEW